jgi:multisubunit Na+/H+ antiporter MnhF subunit
MTTSGLLVMLLSVSTVTLLFSWCVYRVLTTPSDPENVRGMDLHTPDMDQPD